MAVNPVSPGYYVSDTGVLKKILDNLNTINQKVTDAKDGQGADATSDYGVVVSKLKSIQLLDSNGDVQSGYSVKVYVSDGTNAVSDVDDLDDVTTPHLKLKVKDGATTKSDTDIDFDVESYINTVQQHIQTLNNEKSLLLSAKTAVNNAKAYINDNNQNIDDVTGDFMTALDKVKTFIDNLKVGVNELNTAVNNDPAGGGGGKQGYKLVLSASNDDFNTLKAATASKLQEILNDNTKTISEKIQDIKDLILGTSDKYGYLDVVKAKRKIDLAKTSIETQLSVVDNYLTTFQNNVDNLSQQYGQLDTSIQVDPTNNHFKLEDENGNVLEDNLNKINQNVVSIMSTGTSYIKDQAALGMAKTLKDVATAILNSLSDFAGDKSAQAMKNKVDNDYLDGGNGVKDDIDTLKSNINSVKTDMKNLMDIVNNGISTSDIQTTLTNSLNKVSVTFVNTFSINPDVGFKNVFKAVKDAKDNGLGYMDGEVTTLSNKITNDQGIVSKLTLVENGLDNITATFINSTEAQKIESLTRSDSPDYLETQIENNLPTQQLSYDSFVSTFRNKLDFINQKKQEYQDIKTQLADLTGQFIDAVNNGEDTAPILQQMAQLENQENQLVADFQAWYNDLNSLDTTVSNYKTQYQTKADNDSLLSDKAVDESTYGLLYLEDKLIDKLITAISTSPHDLDANDDNILTKSEVESFLDAISTAGLSFDLGADLDVVANGDYTVQDAEIPDITI